MTSLSLSLSLSLSAAVFSPIYNTTYQKSALNVLYYTPACMTNVSGKNWIEIKDISLAGWLGPTAFNYKAFDLVGQPQDMEVLLTAVSPYTAYPFDSYRVSFVASAYLLPQGTLIINGTEVKTQRDFIPLEWETYCSAPAPISFSLTNQAAGFTMSLSTFPSQFGLINASTYIVELTISRSRSTAGISIFVVVVMWLISLGVFVLALDLSMFRNRRPLTLGSVAICATMLFALPSLRSVQPGIPPVGLNASIDIFSYFMNMALIAFSLVLLLVRIIAQNKESKTKRKNKNQSNLTTKEIAMKNAGMASHRSTIEVAISSRPSKLNSTGAMQSP